MYLSFYQLKKEPFHITPDPEFLYLSPSHKQALGSVIYGIEQRKGFIAITGEVGVGKTTILRCYLDRAERKRLKIIYVFNSNVSFGGLVKTIHRELGSTPLEASNVYGMVEQLHAILIEEYRHNRNVALIIDEAQNMPIATLENLRMLSNLETSKDKLIQILLVGQPEFDCKLELHELRQLKQRIAIRCKILPLTRGESLDYVGHRLAKASRKNKTKVFSRGALSLIVKHSRGIPRMLNVLCDNSLITGFGYDQKLITPKIVKEVIADFSRNPDRYGSSEAGKGNSIVVDYSSPNIAKLFSVGHLRSTIIGQALHNILSFLGYQVIGDNQATLIASLWREIKVEVCVKKKC